MVKDDVYFMKLALKEAEKAKNRDEVPVGAIVTKDGKVISRAYNLRETKQDPLGHAEVLAIQKASKKLKSWRLENCTLYVTVEPCVMCAGAIIQSRIKKVVFGTTDYKGGAFGSSINVLESKNINHHPEIISGIMKENCAEIITNYFKQKRKEN